MQDSLTASDLYAAALAEQKHYDNVSLGVVTAMTIVPGAVFQVASEHSQLVAALVSLFGAVVTALLFVLYVRLAKFARTARNVSAAIENGSLREAGISSVFLCRTSSYHAKNGGTFLIVLCLFIVSLLSSLLVGVLSAPCS